MNDRLILPNTGSVVLPNGDPLAASLAPRPPEPKIVLQHPDGRSLVIFPDQLMQMPDAEYRLLHLAMMSGNPLWAERLFPAPSADDDTADPR